MKAGPIIARWRMNLLRRGPVGLVVDLEAVGNTGDLGSAAGVAALAWGTAVDAAVVGTGGVVFGIGLQFPRSSWVGPRSRRDGVASRRRGGSLVPDWVGSTELVDPTRRLWVSAVVEGWEQPRRGRRVR